MGIDARVKKLELVKGEGIQVIVLLDGETEKQAIERVKPDMTKPIAIISEEDMKL